MTCSNYSNVCLSNYSNQIFQLYLWKPSNTHIRTICSVYTCSIEIVKTGICPNSRCSLLEGPSKLTETTPPTMNIYVRMTIQNINLLQESSAYGGKAVRIQVPTRKQNFTGNQFLVIQ